MILYLILISIIIIPLSFMVDSGKIHPVYFLTIFLPASAPIIYYLINQLYLIK